MGCTNSNATESTKAPSNLPNTFRAHYKLGQQLGSGGYSVVHEAINKRDPSQRVAVKITDRASLSKADEEGLRQEIVILQALNHQNIVKFVQSFEDSSSFYVALELLEGGELFDRIVQKTCYNEKEARDLVYILLQAIKYCHDNNVVHRDLKPENLLMTSKLDDASVKIADFGFARHAAGNSLTTQCGSPGYVAPEILENKKYGKPVDMWAMGVITYILLGGYPPFHDDKNQAALFRKIKKGAYEFHPEYWSHISSEAKDLISGLLTVDASKRLTVEQALAHPWLGRSAEELASRNLDSNLKEFKKFHANRKFRSAANAIIAVNKMSKMMNTSSSGTTSEDAGAAGGIESAGKMTSNPSAGR